MGEKGIESRDTTHVGNRMRSGTDKQSEVRRPDSDCQVGLNEKNVTNKQYNQEKNRKKLPALEDDTLN